VAIPARGSTTGRSSACGTRRDTDDRTLSILKEAIQILGDTLLGRLLGECIVGEVGSLTLAEVTAGGVAGVDTVDAPASRSRHRRRR